MYHPKINNKKDSCHDFIAQIKYRERNGVTKAHAWTEYVVTPINKKKLAVRFNDIEIDYYNFFLSNKML